jgi:hypothetical protein
MQSWTSMNTVTKIIQRVSTAGAHDDSYMYTPSAWIFNCTHNTWTVLRHAGDDYSHRRNSDRMYPYLVDRKTTKALLFDADSCLPGKKYSCRNIRHVHWLFRLQGKVVNADGTVFLSALNKVIQHDGLKIVAMIRWAPYPFNYTSFILASLSPGTLSYQTYMLATILSLPKAVLLVWLGSRLETVSITYLVAAFALGAILTFAMVVKVRAQIAAHSIEEGRVVDITQIDMHSRASSMSRSRQQSKTNSPTGSSVFQNNVSGTLPR